MTFYILPVIKTSKVVDSNHNHRSFTGGIFIMDEVPVANANPVNTIVKKNEKANGTKKTSPIAVSLKNLVYMFPLAFVVLLQMFFLGKSFGTFSTLPYASFSSFVFLALWPFFFSFCNYSSVRSSIQPLVAFF